MLPKRDRWELQPEAGEQRDAVGSEISERQIAGESQELLSEQRHVRLADSHHGNLIRPPRPPAGAQVSG